MDLSKLSMVDLADYLLSNPDLVQKMEVSELTQLTQKLNPYSQIPQQATEKSVLFSFTNFKADYYRLLKAISLQMFLSRMEEEKEEWLSKLDLPEGEQESFIRHIKLFSDQFLKYDLNKDLQSSQHTTQQFETPDEFKSLIPPSQDFVVRWQRFEDQHLNVIRKTMSQLYNYTTRYQCALQIYDVFEQEDQVQKFVDSNSLSIGVDIMKVPVNQWVILEDNEETLDKVQFVGDDNKLLDQLIQNMKRDAQLGEKMLKQRVETKKMENQQTAGYIPSEVNDVLETKSYGQRRLELSTSQDINQDTVVQTECPLLLNQGGSDFKKMQL